MLSILSIKYDICIVILSEYIKTQVFVLLLANYFFMRNIFILSLLHACAIANLYAQGEFFVSNSAAISITGTGTLTLENTKLTNNGSVSTSSGTVILKGNASNANSAIGGTGTTALQNLTVNKSANAIQINQNLSVLGNLTLTNGSVELANGNINFGTTGALVNEAETRRVYGAGGNLQATATLNAPNGVNPANLGAMLTSTQNFGNTVITRTHASETSGSIGSYGILRSYNIQPTNNTGLNATLRFHYLDNELNGVSENNLVLWRSTDNGVTWTKQNITNTNATDNWIEISGINAFSKWTASSNAAFPVEYLSFWGENTENRNQLHWTTASENDNLGFTIEKSINSVDFEHIGFVNSNGNSNTPQMYNFIDSDIVADVQYYRLKQTDVNGTYTYSNTINIKSANSPLRAYPNPSVSAVKVSGKSIENGFIILTDANGRQFEIYIENNVFDISKLASGVYYFQHDNEILKLVKL